MDSFLRRVALQRELEQEAAIIAEPVASMLPGACRVCGKAMNMHDEGEQPTVCTGCGGRRAQARLEAEDERRAAREHRRRALLSLAGIQARGEPMADVKTCPKCSKVLRSNNTRGVCKTCWDEGHRLDGDAPPQHRVKKNPDTLKRFKVVADALGFDSAQLINDFAEAWLEQLAGKMRQFDAESVET